MKHLMNVIESAAPEVNGAVGPVFKSPDGREYLDWWSNSGCSPFGSWSEPYRRAVIESFTQPTFVPQIHRFWPREDLAMRWCKAAGMDRAFFSNSGTEAVETAIKLLRKGAAGGHRTIWTVADSFHGRTYGALAAGNGPDYHYDGMGPHLEGFRHFAEPREVDPDDCAGILMTPIQCYKDADLYGPFWWKQLADLLLANPHIGLALDDIQTSAGRCGEIEMGEWVNDRLAAGTDGDFNPDITCIGKGAALGLPLSITLARGRYAEAFKPGDHFCTFGGASVLPMLAASEMLDWLYDNCEAIRERGEYLHDKLARLPWMKRLRGLGMMWAFEADGVASPALVEGCYKFGLIVTAFGDPIKIFPPLDSSRERIDEGIWRLEQAYAYARAGGEE